MIAMTLGAALLAMWVIYAIVAIAGIVAVFVWAVRSRQFSDQDRARSLPLASGIPTSAACDNAAPAAEKPAPDDSRGHGG
jgi:cbb3-type cytochrome oxidase maturation protein